MGEKPKMAWNGCKTVFSFNSQFGFIAASLQRSMESSKQKGGNRCEESCEVQCTGMIHFFQNDFRDAIEEFKA